MGALDTRLAGGRQMTDDCRDGIRTSTIFNISINISIHYSIYLVLIILAQDVHGKDNHPYCLHVHDKVHELPLAPPPAQISPIDVP